MNLIDYDNMHTDVWIKWFVKNYNIIKYELYGEKYEKITPIVEGYLMFANCIIIH